MVTRGSRLGQLLIVGFDGTELPAELEASLRREERGGVILFRRNLPTLAEARALCVRTHASLPSGGSPLFVAVDQEGGRVRRLPSPPFLHLPAMRQLAHCAPDLIRAAARENAEQLCAVGFNFNFAPVVDVDTNPANPVIGDRSFGESPDAVISGARAFLEGQRVGGVAGCLKHFPGHGDTELDSHFALPRVRHPKARIDTVELRPFAALHAAADAIMSAHVIFDALDPGVPATLSRRICHDLLRTELGFTGMLVSDDLEMRAVADAGSVEDNAVLSIEAGCDALLVCRDPELQVRAHEALIRKAATSPAFRERCEEALARTLCLRATLAARTDPFSATELAARSEAMERRIAEARGEDSPPQRG